MRAFATLRSALAAAAFFVSALAGQALAQSAPSAVAPYPPKSAAPEAMRLAPRTVPAAVVRLAAMESAQIDAVRHANTLSPLKRLQIGVGRDVEALPESSDAALRWTPVAGGYAAQWQVVSAEARALRVGLVAANLAAGTEIRFMGSALDTVYGPFTAADVKPRTGVYWSPVLEGDTATVEVYVPAGTQRADLSLAIAQVSHLFASPAHPDVEMQAKAAGFCEVDIICRSSSDAALASVGRAVARMTFSDGNSGGSFLCTGTLLNPASGPLTPYFYGANHCISTQASASTLTTHWFYDATSCGSGVISSSYVQVTGGATLLYANEPSDVLLLRLNNSPPGGATYAGWDATTLNNGTALTAVHHPAGDLKKVSLGTMGGFGSYPGLSGSFIIARWNAIATGVTEGGSSGSGIFTKDGTADYRLRGGLLGGPSSCTASSASLYDNYSRLDQAYSSLAQFLNPGGGGGVCTYAISPASISLGSGSGSGSFGVTAAGGCAWSAVSNASWLTTSSSGSGNGTVSYSVAANSGSTPRTGTITVGGQTFTVTQSAPLATTSGNLLANPGFESGDSAWTQIPGGTIITNGASIAHAGSWYGWLGGYDDGTDTLFQDVTIPASSTGARVQFWYLISTQETSTTTVYDKMTVTLVNPATGQVLATLATLTNLNATSGWTLSPAYDVSAFRGQTVRLRFVAVTDFSLISSFRIDDVSLAADVTAGTTNYTAMWWIPQESGWGFNVNHQGDTIFATLFTYDSSGNPMWLVLANGARQGSSTTYTGDLYRTTGSPFNAVPFVPSAASDVVKVGTMTVTFSGGSDATLSYNVNGTSVTKSIIKEVFGNRAAECVGSTASRTSVANYTDMWWNANESGWGINVTQQGDVIFATLFTYAPNRQGMWYVLANAPKQGDGSYLGDLYRTTGPAFNAAPFNPASVAAIAVGTMRLRFTSGTTATLDYTVNGAAVSKQITRQVFSSPAPICF